jgi:hypothetical protein
MNNEHLTPALSPLASDANAEREMNRRLVRCVRKLMSAQARRWKRIRYEQTDSALVRHCLNEAVRLRELAKAWETF